MIGLPVAKNIYTHLFIFRPDGSQSSSEDQWPLSNASIYFLSPSKLDEASYVGSQCTCFSNWRHLFAKENKNGVGVNAVVTLLV